MQNLQKKADGLLRMHCFWAANVNWNLGPLEKQWAGIEAAEMQFFAVLKVPEELLISIKVQRFLT